MITIDLVEGSPKYKQIIEQIKRAIVSCELKPGDHMPTARELSRTLQVNIATVARAYRILKRDGILGIRRRSGTFVSGSIDYSQRKLLRRSHLMAMTDRFILEALSQGYDPDELESTLLMQITRWTIHRGSREII